MLKGKNVLLAVSAGIAAYKSAFLCRLLIKKGANVKVLMTPHSANFITPLTFSTLSKNPVYLDYFDEKDGSWNNHVELAKWADFFLLAPATANTLSKMANGLCDNVLLATYLSMSNPVFIAPAMDLDMYQHPAIKDNLRKLESFGHFIIPAESGELASGLDGEGRMPEPANIIAFLEQKLNPNSKLSGKKILITAGPTYEVIDPVRFLGNRSSGKMGYALAKEAINLGAEVSLISGPSSLKPPAGLAQFKEVESADEMFHAVKELQQESEIIIMSAAVSDYAPVSQANQKIKKSSELLKLELKKNPDILHWLGKNKRKGQKLIGFALETENEEEHAKEKLKRKKLDMIVLNSLKHNGAGFNSATNQVTFFFNKKEAKAFTLKDKSQVAKDILNEIQQFYA